MEQKVIDMSKADTEERVNKLLAEGFMMVGMMGPLLLLTKNEDTFEKDVETWAKNVKPFGGM